MSPRLGYKSVSSRQSGANTKFNTVFYIPASSTVLTKYKPEIRLSTLHHLFEENIAQSQMRNSAWLRTNGFVHHKWHILFLTFPPIQSALKELRLHSSSVQLWPSESVFDQLPGFLSKQRATGGSCVYRAERRSLKAAETHVSVFLLPSALHCTGTR